MNLQIGDTVIVQDGFANCREDQSSISTTPTETITSPQNFGDYRIMTFTAHSTTSYTINCSNAPGLSFGLLSATIYRGTFNGFGSATLDPVGGGPGSTGSDTINLNVGAGSQIYEGIQLYNNNQSPSNCPNFALQNGQTLRVNNCTTTINAITEGVVTIGPTAGSGVSTLGMTWSNCTGGTSVNCQVRHSAIELTSVPVNPTSGVTTPCYGVCGNPPVTLINPNATHSINFNISSTFFYFMQSQLNGFVDNVTVNLAKSYTNGLVMYLGLYLTQPCTVQQTPFSANCPGLLQTSNTFVNPLKGKNTMPLQTPIQIGNWIGIAVSSNIGGLDLNETNGTCGFTGGVNCAFPPGMVQTSGIMPTSIASYIIPNITHLNNTGLWAYVTGSITSGIPPPPAPGSGCNISDLSCFEVQSICGLSTSNCLAAGIVYLIIYMAIFILAIFLGVGYLKSKYEIEVHLDHIGSLFIGVFFLLTVLFTTWGIFPVYIPVAEFMILAFTWAIILRSGAEAG